MRVANILHLGIKELRGPGLHQGWHLAIDTFLESPHDICDGPDAPLIADETYRVEPRSTVLLFALRATGAGQGGLLPG